MSPSQQTALNNAKRYNEGSNVSTVSRAELDNFAYENDLNGVDTHQLAILYKWHNEELVKAFEKFNNN